ncbi:uncharacterized protein LOC144914482 [Branchiostoma floridae x Branchiostoma belcheri]
MRTTATLPIFLVVLVSLWRDVNSRPAKVHIGDLLYEDGPLWESSSAETTFPDYGSGSAEADPNINLVGEAKNDESSFDLSEDDFSGAAERHRRVRRSLLGRYKSHCRRRHGSNGQYDRFRPDEAKVSQQARRKARAPDGVYNNGGHPVVVQTKRSPKCRSRWCSMAYFLRKVKAYGFWKKSQGQAKRVDTRSNNLDFIDWNTLEAMP